MHRLMFLLALTPLSAAAQAHASAGLFVARNSSLHTAPNLAGLELRSGYGALAMRLSAGAGPVFSAVFGERGVDREHVYGAVDLDLQLDLAGPRAFSVMPFAGIGMVGLSRIDRGGADAAAMWSYGGSARVPFGGNVALQLETRRRAPFDDVEAFSLGIVRGWEQRVGLTFGFGGGGGARRASADPRETRESYSPRVTTPSRDRVTMSRVTARRLRLIESAESHLGTRYRLGGVSPREGFDCSGFVRHVYANHGTTLPRTAREQAKTGRRVTYRRGVLLPGDLLFFRLESSRIDHVAMYAGDGRIIHSTSSGRGVRLDDLDSPRGRWFMQRLDGVRRIIEE
jgi:cell wall-associated NlpC family hydrolase